MGVVDPLVAKGRTPSGVNREGQSTDAGHWDGAARSSDEGPVMGLEPRGRADQGKSEANPAGEEPGETPKPKVKSFEIDKRLVYRAWEKVRANYGAPGVDAVSINQFQERERDNLYKLWNLGELLPWPGAGGGDTQGSREGRARPRGAECGRPGGADGGSDAAGGEAGADLPP